MEEEPLPSPVKPPVEGTSRWADLARRRLPILVWLPRYSCGAALADAVAGLTLGLTLVPQSIAYAALADLPLHYGLYSAFVGTMLYVLLGTVKEVSIGPTSLMALMTLQACHGLHPAADYAVLLAFLAGGVVFAMGLLQLGFMVDLISQPVVSGFTSATVVIVVVSQIKSLLGMSFVAESVWDNARLMVLHRHEVQLGDCLLALVCCTTLLLLRKVKDIPVSSDRRGVRKALWLVSIGRNAAVVAAASIVAYCTFDHHKNKHPWFKLSGRVEPGLPPIGLPPFSTVGPNGTAVGFVEMASHLGSGIVLTPIVMVLANIAIAKAFSTGGRVDATQEMLTLGLCNMVGSLVRAMPTCGAFTRSAVSHASGVRTPLAGLYSGLITLLALAFMTKYFYFIPRACLSSVLICAVIFMFDTATMRRLWRRERGSLCVLALTFLVGVGAGVEAALATGALLDLARPLRRLHSPPVSVTRHKSGVGEVAVVCPALGLTYLSAEHVAARIAEAAAAVCPRPVLLDCRLLQLLDEPAVMVLERTIKQLKSLDQQLIIFNCSEAALERLRGAAGVCSAALAAATVEQALAAAAPRSPDTAGTDLAPLLP